MNAITKEWTAEDYSYRLPDHWLLDDQNPSGYFEIVHRAYVDRVVELVKESGSRTVIEVGCGDGWNCAKLVEAGLDVVGIDWSKNGTDHAARLTPKAQIYCGDVRDADFSARFPQPFDAVVLVEVIEHIPPNDCVKAIRNIAATIKVGGTFVLTTPATNVPNTNPQHYRHFDEQTLRSLIADAGGLTINSIEGYGDYAYRCAMYRKLRWFDNRYYTIKPVKKRMLEQYRGHCSQTPLSTCEGFVVSMTKTA